MNYHKIDICNMNNGDGLRVVLWVAGCSYHCPQCFNAKTWDFNGGDKFGEPQMDLIKFALSQDWCEGLTLTGGDPLAYDNLPDVYDIVSTVKNEFPNKTIWIYTGNTYENINHLSTRQDNNNLEGIIVDNYCDVLVDGSFIYDLKSPNKHWVGSSNQRVIDVKQSLISQTIIELS